MSDCIVLIPGFFGFGQFRDSRGDAVSYFENVIETLSRAPRSGGAEPIPADRIYVHEPPPTGSLRSRVRSLHGKVLEVVGEQHLLGNPDAVVHLVGHSTGGVDAWLLTQPAFDVPRLAPDVRRSVARRIGKVVTIAAPLHGTPIAGNLAIPFQLLLDALTLMMLLDRANAPWLTRTLLSAAVALLDFATPASVTNDRLLKLLHDVDPDLAKDFGVFRGRILSDDALLHDLRPDGMASVHAAVARAPTPVAMKHFVTIAPAPLRLARAALVELRVPRVADVAAQAWQRVRAAVARPAAAGRALLDGGAEEIEETMRRAVFALCYELSSSPAFPANGVAAWTDLPAVDAAAGSAARQGWLEPPPLANDGVIPSTSQFLSRADAELVLADHADVIGHFDGRRNTTPFKSGSSFDADRHARFWSRVAASLRG